MEPTGRLRDDADFRHYWWARVLSTSGSVITLIALPVLVYRMSNSALLTAVASALEAAPYLFFGLFAGALADRMDRRRLMIGADFAKRTPLSSAHLPRSRWCCRHWSE
ncbi:MAG: MFS transporter [Nocardioidaceae bacterium]